MPNDRLRSSDKDGRVSAASRKITNSASYQSLHSQWVDPKRGWCTFLIHVLRGCPPGLYRGSNRERRIFSVANRSSTLYQTTLSTDFDLVSFHLETPRLPKTRSVYLSFSHFCLPSRLLPFFGYSPSASLFFAASRSPSYSLLRRIRYSEPFAFTFARSTVNILLSLADPRLREPFLEAKIRGIVCYRRLRASSCSVRRPASMLAEITAMSRGFVSTRTIAFLTLMSREISRERGGSLLRIIRSNSVSICLILSLYSDIHDFVISRTFC